MRFRKNAEKKTGLDQYRFSQVDEDDWAYVVKVGVGLSREINSFEPVEVSQRPKYLLGRSSELGSKTSSIFQSPSARTTVTVEIW